MNQEKHRASNQDCCPQGLKLQKQWGYVPYMYRINSKILRYQSSKKWISTSKHTQIELLNPTLWQI